MLRLTDLSRYNPWWSAGEKFAELDYDLRRIKLLIRRRTKEFSVGNVYVIRGPRRSGKSVYIKLIIRELIGKGEKPRSILYLPCDRLSSRKELSRIIREFLRFNIGEKVFLFLDEVTYLPEWFLVVKDLAETDVEGRVCVVATGSSPVSLKEATERLPGRRIEGNELWLMPISFREFILNTPKRLLPISEAKLDSLREKLRSLKFSFDEPDLFQVSQLYPWHEELDILLDIYLRTGGIPQFIVDYLARGRIEAKEMEMLIRFILGEISKAKKSELVALGILRYLTNNLMQRVDYKKIADSIDTHHSTVKEIIETLQKALIIFQIKYLDPTTQNISEKKQKKFAFSDIALITSLRSYIYGYSWDDILWDIEKLKPELIENLIATTAIISLHIPYKKEWWTRIGYYYTKKYEVDLVVKSANKVQTYEVKYTEKVRPTKARITITKSELDPEKSRIPATYILATTKKSPKIL